jgi:transcriptional regulator with XRE-family HTH domain
VARSRPVGITAMNLRRSAKLPRKLLLIREMLGLTAEEMIETLGIEEWITAEDISAYEAGKSQPPLPFLLVVAHYANISTDVLIDDRRRLPKRLPARKRY